MSKTIIINGSAISSEETFYQEIDRVLTKNLTWETGHNLNAFNDLLRGGFGVHELNEPITLIWKDFEASKLKLGRKFTDAILEILVEHDHITFEIEDKEE
jgi:RNAse (barnase) inhibitor barstar